MKKKSFLIASLLFIPVFLLLAQSTPAPRITPEDAKILLTENSQAILLDVRTKAEYESRRIPGSILLSLADLSADSTAKVIGPTLDRPIVVYCASGGRSRAASVILLSLGYTQVWDLGGISSWPFETTQSL